MGSNQVKFARELKDNEVQKLHELMSMQKSLREAKSGHARSGATGNNVNNSNDSAKLNDVLERYRVETQQAVLSSPDLETYNHGRDRAMMVFLMTTGLRIGELTKLTVGQVYRDGGIVEKFALTTDQTKRKKAGWVYLNDRCRKVLLEYICMYELRSVSVDYGHEPRSQNKWAGFEWGAENPLFPSARYDMWLKDPMAKPWDRVWKRRPLHLTSIAAANIFKKYFKQAGIGDASSHSFRRTFANRLRRKGIDVRVIQDLLRHSHLNTTMRYLQADEVELSRAVENL